MNQNTTPKVEGVTGMTEIMVNPSFDAREADCFWVHEGCEHAELTDPQPCSNRAETLIYWDGHYEPICRGCKAEAEQLRWDILNAIDEGILRNAL